MEEGCINPLRVMEEILRQPEFIFEKPSYDKYHKSRLPQQPLPGFLPSIIPSDLFLLIITAFTETYPPRTLTPLSPMPGISHPPTATPI